MATNSQCSSENGNSRRKEEAYHNNWKRKSKKWKHAEQTISQRLNPQRGLKDAEKIAS